MKWIDKIKIITEYGWHTIEEKPKSGDNVIIVYDYDDEEQSFQIECGTYYHKEDSEFNDTNENYWYCRAEDDNPILTKNVLNESRILAWKEYEDDNLLFKALDKIAEIEEDED